MHRLTWGERKGGVDGADATGHRVEIQGCREDLKNGRWALRKQAVGSKECMKSLQTPYWQREGCRPRSQCELIHLQRSWLAANKDLHVVLFRSNPDIWGMRMGIWQRAEGSSHACPAGRRRGTTAAWAQNHRSLNLYLLGKKKHFFIVDIWRQTPFSSSQLLANALLW